MKLKGIFLFLITCFFIACSPKVYENTTIKEKEFRVIGYLPSYKFDAYKTIKYKHLTHLNLSFANPDKVGNLSINGNVDVIIDEAKEQNPNLIISISLAGGILTDVHAENWANLIDNPLNRPAFINKIIAFVTKHNFDGIDVDLEWDNVTKGYSDFVLELATAISDKNILLTAALPNTTRFVNITDNALNAFDFINIMAYDKTGTWAPDKPGQHSSLEFAEEGIAFWKNQNISKEKLTLGVPFYGYDFTPGNVKQKTYQQIISEKGVESADKDNVENIFYNGRITIREKTKLAIQKTSGIMIWELTQDSFNEFSLFDVIYKEIKK